MGKINRSDFVEATPTLDTNAYATGDYMGLVEISGALSCRDAGAVLQSISVIDKSDQAGALDIAFFSRLPTIASAANAAISMTDANAAYYIGHVSIASADYLDFVDNRVANAKNIGLGVYNNETDSGGNSRTSIWAVLISRDAKTYAASGITLRAFFLKD